jgi:MFS family permease
MTEAMGRPRGTTALTAAYVGFGVFWAAWSVVFLEFVTAHGFTFTVQSWFMMSLSLSSMVAMVVLSPRIVPLRPNISLPLAVGCYGAGILLMPFVNGAGLVVAFAVTGIGTGLIDVLVNQMGHRLEGESGRSILQGIHAGYSIGAIVGAMGAAFILSGGGDGAWRVVLVCASLLQLPAFVMCALEPSFRHGHGERAEESVSLTVFVRRPALMATALIVLSAFFIEGSLDVWAVSYLRKTLGSSIIAGALGFSAFALATAIGRLFAGRILFGMGYKRTILFSGIGSVLAGTLAVLAPNAAVAALAYLLMGFCLSAAGPAAFGSVPGSGTEAGVAIAAVTTVGYIGFVIGPPLMGWLADAAGIRSVMVVITLATLGILLGGYLSRDYARDMPVSES